MIDAVIPINTALSQIIHQAGWTVVGIVMPGAWDTAALTFLGGVDTAAVYKLVNGAGAELSLTVAAATCIYLPVISTDLGGVRVIQLRSGTAATPVNQTAERTIQLVCRKLGV